MGINGGSMPDYALTIDYTAINGEENTALLRIFDTKPGGLSRTP